MRKIYVLGLLLFVTILSGCGKSDTIKNTNLHIDTKQIEQKLNGKEKLVNVDEKVNQLKQEFTKLGFTGDKLEKLIKEQKKNYETLTNLTGDAMKKYVFENMFLPELVKDSITPSFCKTNKVALYAKCIYKKGVKLEDIEKKLPSGLKDYFKKVYYFQKYDTKRSNLLKETDNPIAIEQKKQVLLKLSMVGLLKKSDCARLPEDEVKSYCKKLFK